MLTIDNRIRQQMIDCNLLIFNSIKMLKNNNRNMNMQINSSITKEYPPNNFKKNELTAKLIAGNETNLRFSIFTEKLGLKFKLEKDLING